MSSLYNTRWIKHKLVVSIYSNTETSLAMSTLAVWCRVVRSCDVRSRDFSAPTLRVSWAPARGFAGGQLNILKPINSTALYKLPNISIALKCSHLLTDSNFRVTRYNYSVKHKHLYNTVFIVLKYNKYKKMMFLYIWNRLCHWMRFREQSKRFECRAKAYTHIATRAAYCSCSGNFVTQSGRPDYSLQAKIAPTKLTCNQTAV